MSEMIDRAGGGGSKYHPYTLEDSQRILGPQVQVLRNAARSLDGSLRADHVVFEVKLLPNYLANSYFPDRLVKLLGLTALGSRPATGDLILRSTTEFDVPTKSLIVAGGNDSLEQLTHILSGNSLSRREKGAAEDLRRFSDIHLPRVAEVVRGSTGAATEPVGGREPFEAVLHPDPDLPGISRRPLSGEVFEKFERYIRSLGGEVVSDRRDVVGGLTFVPVLLPSNKAKAAAAFNPLRSIRKMPRIRPVPAIPLRSAPGVSKPAPPPARADAPEVLIFDAGVEVNGDFFAGSVNQVDLSGRPGFPGSIEHGSAVTGAVLYGSVEAGSSLQSPQVRATHFRCIPGHDTDGAELYWLLDQIQKQVADSDAMIVNLSLGPEVPVDDGEPHRWTAVLDALAYERDILFVVAVGNNGEEDGAGENRVQVPADMANGLSVGACDRPHPELMWSRPSYSAIGPGRPGATVQPAVLAFGGDSDLPFARLMGDGRLSYDWGTSYAAPLAAHGLAKLSTQLGDRASASALRSFAIHFAEPHADSGHILESGYGRLPVDFSDALLCSDRQVTVLYQSSIEREQILGFTLPVPGGIDRGKVKVKWTLSYASSTDPTEAVEYTESGLEFTLRPHSEVYGFRDPEKSSRIIKVNIREEADRVADLLEEGWKMSQQPVSRSQKVGPKASESNRRRGGKWETVMQGQDCLMASSLHLPRLDIEFLTREGGVLTRDSPPVEFSLVVTVESLSGLPVYDLAKVDFPVLSELPVPVPLRLRT
ncbi:S8 family peptidase [Streptomyces atriruber]|uniref:S8 family peptidase n=1 Tax=Streptomyces atriruber TaxID=545121 RepID=UPI000A90CC74|nr:S8 family peptidase [Streptomyces atriruber]